MMKTMNNQVGENKLEKLVRLMNRYEQQLQSDEVEKVFEVYITLTTKELGTIFCNDRSLFDFNNLEDLFTFLEAGQVKRTLMVRG